jgi:hypothetical protein
MSPVQSENIFAPNPATRAPLPLSYYPLRHCVDATAFKSLERRVPDGR